MGTLSELEVQFTPEQMDMLSRLVEASLAKREQFLVLRYISGMYVQHPGFPNGKLDVYPPDFQALEDLGLFTITHYDSRDGKSTAFDISPVGRNVYSRLHTESMSAASAVERELTQFIDAERFKSQHPDAFERWNAAAQLLWAGDSNGQLTEVGHYCREAMQELAAGLAAGLPVMAESAKPDTVRRMRAVLEKQKHELGETSHDMLDAMLAYWGTVSDLAQRQEHAGSREYEPLQWEDARRLVFQTLIVMYEFDRITSVA